MNPEHKKLLEDFERFELDLEVDAILMKVKADRVPDEGVTEFAQQLEETRRNGRRRETERSRSSSSGCRVTTRS